MKVSEVGGIYNASSMKDAEELAQVECNYIYELLRGRCNVEVESIEEVVD